MRSKRFFRFQPLARLYGHADRSVRSAGRHLPHRHRHRVRQRTLAHRRLRDQRPPDALRLRREHQDNVLIHAWNELSSGDSWRLERVQSEYYIIRNTDTQKCLKPATPARAAKETSSAFNPRAVAGTVTPAVR